MGFALRQTAAPAAEPVTLDETRNHLRVEHDRDDVLIEQQIASARDYIEGETGRQLITATWLLAFDAFPSTVIRIPKPPLQSITSVKYYDGDGVQQTMDAADFQVDVYAEPGRITPAYGTSWPTTRAMLNAVQVTFVAGFGDASTDVAAAVLGQKLRQAVLLMVAHMYEFREPVITGTIVNTVPMAVKSIVQSCRSGWIF